MTVIGLILLLMFLWFLLFPYELGKQFGRVVYSMEVQIATLKHTPVAVKNLTDADMGVEPNDTIKPCSLCGSPGTVMKIPFTHTYELRNDGYLCSRSKLLGGTCGEEIATNRIEWNTRFFSKPCDSEMSND